MQGQLVERVGDGEGHAFTLLVTTTKIGRSEDNDIVLSSPRVSRNHAEICWQEAGYVLRDLESRNGTYVNGQRLEAPWSLHRGDVVVLGGVSFTFHTDETMAAGPPYLRLDPASVQVWLGERRVQVTAMEYRALALLYEKQGTLVTKDELVDRIWEGAGNDETVAQLISRLRRKLEPNPDQSCYLLTVRGMGYRLMPAGADRYPGTERARHARLQTVGDG